MKLWGMGQVKSQDGSVWELGGVFSTRELAVAAREEPTDCVFSIVVDRSLSRETVPLDDCVYPLAPTAL